MFYLALDPAVSCIGYAIGSPTMKAPLTGMFRPQRAGSQHGVMCASVRDFLDARIKTYHIRHVIFETPLPGRNTGVYAVVNKLIGIIELVCDDHEIPATEARPDDWRAHFIGATRAPAKLKESARRTWLKQQALKACASRGWDVKSHDEAEACGLLDFKLALDFPDYGAKTAPLFKVDAA